MIDTIENKQQIRNIIIDILSKDDTLRDIIVDIIEEIAFSKAILEGDKNDYVNEEIVLENLNI